MKYLARNKYLEINKEYNVDKLLYLLVDRCDEINIFDDFLWINKKRKLHRDYNLPAEIWSKGETFWWKNGNEYYYIDEKFVEGK